jgi:urease gamma subunit
MTLIGNFTGGTMSASTVTINTTATVDSVQVNGTDVINGMRTGRAVNPFTAEGTNVTISFGLTLPSVPNVILQIEVNSTFCNTVVISAVTTTGFTAYFYKSGTNTNPTIDALNWWAIY